MITISFVGMDGRAVENFRIQRLLKVDGETFPPAPPVPSVQELSNRLCIVEALIAQVIGETSLPPQPLPECSSVESS